MLLYPAFLKLENIKCLVIGGGKIAERKTISLLSSGANISLISPDITLQLKVLVSEKKIQYNERAYFSGDLNNFFLIIAATNNKNVNTQIYQEAIANNQLINCVDDPEHCNFYLPAVVTQGDLQIAISSSGKAPLLAKSMMHELENHFYPEFEKDFYHLAILRQQIIEEAADDKEKKDILIEAKLKPETDKIINKLKNYARTNRA